MPSHVAAHDRFYPRVDNGSTRPFVLVVFAAQLMRHGYEYMRTLSMQNSLHSQFVLRGGYTTNPALWKAVGFLLLRLETLLEGRGGRV